MAVGNSSPTYGSWAFDVPEPEDLAGEFIYNYFAKDERVTTNTYSDLEAWKRHGGDPNVAGAPASTGEPSRKIKLTFTPLSHITTLTNSSFSEPRRKGDLRRGSKILLSEVAVQSERTCFLSLQDDDLASELQAIIDAEIQKEMAEARGLSPLEAVLKYSSLTTDDISMDDILDLTDVESQSNLTYYDPVTGEDLTVQKQGGVSEYAIGGFFNKKFVHDVLKGSENVPYSPLWGTVSDLLTEANGIQELAVYDLDSNLATMSDYEFAVTPISKKTILNSPTTPTVEPCGYLIRKFEIRGDGRPVPAGVFPVASMDLSEIFDLDVRYGATYRYQIQSVFYLSTTGAETKTLKKSEQEYNTFLVASRGSPYIDVVCEEAIPPPPPTNIEFFLSSTQKLIMFWNMPYNTQEDIKRWQIFRRESLEDPYTIIMEIDFDDSVVQTSRSEYIPDFCKLVTETQKNDFTDEDFEFDKTYYYAMCAVDAHDLSSPYSTQFEVKYDRVEGAMNVRTIAHSGAPKPYPNFTLSETLIVDCIKDSGHTKMKLYFDPEALLLKGVEKEIELIGGKTTVGREYEKYLETNSEYAMYKIQIINLDWQQDQKIDVYLKRATNLIGRIAKNLAGE
jgi:hypothetical protein